MFGWTADHIGNLALTASTFTPTDRTLAAVHESRGHESGLSSGALRISVVVTVQSRVVPDISPSNFARIAAPVEPAAQPHVGGVPAPPGVQSRSRIDWN
jgi:hypothetical protein